MPESGIRTCLTRPQLSIVSNLASWASKASPFTPDANGLCPSNVCSLFMCRGPGARQFVFAISIPGGLLVTQPRNPHLVTTVKCAAPGCTNVRREAITGSLSRLNSVLLAAHIRLSRTCAPWTNRLAARHVLKSFLKDISQSRPYDNTAQPNTNRFSRTREKQNGFRSRTFISFHAALLTSLCNTR